MDRRQVIDAWDRFQYLWEILYAVAYVGTTVLLLLEDSQPIRKTVAVLAVAGIAGAYILLGRRAVRNDSATSLRWLFAAALVLLSGAAIFADTSASFILFMVCPLLFTTLPFRSAAVTNAVVVLLDPLSLIARGSVGGPGLHIILPMSAILIVFGILVGRFIGHVISESQARAELIRQLEASQAEVARLSRDAGTATERERLAREIHDTLAQGFTSIITLTQAIESELDTDPATARRHVELAARTARENLDEARTMVAALAPADLTAGSLEEAIRRLVDRLSDETSLAVTYQVDGSLPPLGMAAEVVLLRGAQEALNNVRRHARAQSVSIRLSVVDDVVRLAVHDDGVGFEPGECDGFGLRSMRSRAEQVGGRLTVRTGRSKGTDVELEVPA